MRCFPDSNSGQKLHVKYQGISCCHVWHESYRPTRVTIVFRMLRNGDAVQFDALHCGGS